jgi:hypothetical protein
MMPKPLPAAWCPVGWPNPFVVAREVITMTSLGPRHSKPGHHRKPGHPRRDTQTTVNLALAEIEPRSSHSRHPSRHLVNNNRRASHRATLDSLGECQPKMPEKPRPIVDRVAVASGFGRWPARTACGSVLRGRTATACLRWACSPCPRRVRRSLGVFGCRYGGKSGQKPDSLSDLWVFLWLMVRAEVFSRLPRGAV